MSRYFVKATGAAAIASSYTPTSEGQFDGVMLHLSAGGAATNLTVKFNSVDGAAYDTVLATQDMNGVTDYFYQPTRPIPMRVGDTIDVAYANGGGATYGLTFLASS